MSKYLAYLTKWFGFCVQPCYQMNIVEWTTKARSINVNQILHLSEDGRHKVRALQTCELADAKKEGFMFMQEKALLLDTLI